LPGRGAAVFENDGNALDWCVLHNADNAGHHAMIVAGSE
jgi:hypothetical protein